MFIFLAPDRLQVWPVAGYKWQVVDGVTYIVV